MNRVKSISGSCSEKHMKESIKFKWFEKITPWVELNAIQAVIDPTAVRGVGEHKSIKWFELRQCCQKLLIKSVNINII